MQTGVGVKEAKGKEPRRAHVCRKESCMVGGLCHHRAVCGGQGRAVGSRLSLPSPALQGIADCSNPWSLTLKFLKRGLAEVVYSAHSDDAQSINLKEEQREEEERMKEVEKKEGVVLCRSFEICVLQRLLVAMWVRASSEHGSPLA